MLPHKSDHFGNESLAFIVVVLQPVLVPIPSGLPPNGIAPTELHPRDCTQTGLHPSGLHPRDCTHTGLHPSELHPHGIAPTLNCTHPGLHPQRIAPTRNCTHTGLHPHRIAPTQNCTHTGLHPYNSNERPILKASDWLKKSHDLKVSR